MSDIKIYAINKTSALTFVKTTFDECTYTLGSSQCACGESPTLFLQHPTGISARIIICEACYVDAAPVDKTLAYFDEDITREELEERYNTAVENSDFVVVGDQEYNPETIRYILDKCLFIH